MNSKKARALLTQFEETDFLGQQATFLKKREAFVQRDTKESYLGFLSAELPVLALQETDLMLLVQARPPILAPLRSFDELFDAYIASLQEERTLCDELTSLLVTHRQQTCGEKLALLDDIATAPYKYVFPVRPLSTPERCLYEEIVARVAVEAEEVALCIRMPPKIPLCFHTLSYLLWLSPGLDASEATKPSNYLLAQFIRPLMKHLVEARHVERAQAFREAYAILKGVFGRRVRRDTLLRCRQEELHAIVQQQMDATRHNRVITSALKRFQETLTQAINDVDKLQRHEDIAELTRVENDLDRLLDAAVKAFNGPKRENSRPIPTPIEPRQTTVPNTKDLAERIQKAQAVARHKVSQQVESEQEARELVQRQGEENAERKRLAEYRACLVRLRNDLDHQTREQHRKQVQKQREAEQRRKDAANAEAEAVRPVVERSRERVLAPTASLLYRKLANEARRQYLSGVKNERIFHTGITLDGESVHMAGKDGLVHDNQENSVSAIAHDLMVEYGIIETQYARDALAQLRETELAERFHHYSLQDNVGALLSMR
ncbi:hypothetical protein GMRT_13787 [Giardia muris]|uniref:Uncharacterized protein n=1 Tax=Giardia muris TaxID=5742 RepID=A0A4Z1SS41_GIAMU|nr:hypothetical protein GMRT_13787 [Giardia muris]|eukprot:TNJ28742.1 hypothetical protein GMRT_13787 [Giardia muris]